MKYQELEPRQLLSVQDLSSFPADFTDSGSEIVFAAQDSAGYEPWKYNGSVASRIADINPAGSSFPSEFTVVGSSLYFVASAGNDEFRLWKYSGGSVSIVLDPSGTAPVNPTNLINFNGTLMFVADDGVHGEELWTSNGTAAGTTLVKDIFPDDVTLNGPDQLTVVGSTLYFIAYEHLAGWELWQSNGTTIGTERVADIHPGIGGSLPQELTAVGSNLYFRADDATHGEELWIRAGTNPPVLVADLDPFGAARPRDLTAVGGELYFSTIEPVLGGAQVWVTDGTGVGTELLETFHPNGGWDTGAMVDVGGDLFLSVAANNETNGWELWKVDGTTHNSMMLAEFADWGQWLDPWTMSASDDHLYFNSFDKTFGHELWISDGTIAGTHRLTDINPRVGNASPHFITGIGDAAYFAANDGNTGIEPYFYEPTGFGLQRIANIADVDTGPRVQVTLAFDSDSGYENDDGITNFTTPTFVVDVNQPGQVSIDFNDDGVFEFSQAVDNWGTRQFAPPTPFVDGVHTVTVRFTANSMTVEDSTDITIDTVGPTLIGSYPVEDTIRDFHTLFFDEPLNEEHVFEGDFLLSGPGFSVPLELTTFFIDFQSDEIDVGFAPLTTPGIYSVTIDSGLEDLAGNLLQSTSPNTTSFQVLANAVFLDDPLTTYSWNAVYEGKDLVIDNAVLQVSGLHDLASLWLLNGATIQSLPGQALQFSVTGNVTIDATSTIDVDGSGLAGGAIGVAGTGSGGGAAGTTGGGGGGYGGLGGTGGTTANAPGGTTYGVVTMPIDLGSGGGGSAASTGGAGGGAIKFTAGTTIQLDGLITANGLTGVGVNGSGGAGGSIWLVAASFEGDGTIQAKGADAVGVAGAGAGGRISLVSPVNVFTGTTTAAGGIGTDALRNGGAGTISITSSVAAARAPAALRLLPPRVRHTQRAPVRYEVKVNKSDRGPDIKKSDSIKKLTKKNSVTQKNLSPSNYQVRYKGQISKSNLAAQSITAFNEPPRGVPRTLQFSVRPQLMFLPTVVWDAGGNGTSWSDPLNWSTNTVPGPNDLVSIPSFPGTTVTLTGTVKVVALFSDSNVLLNGSLTVTDVSNVNAQFSTSTGATLTADGAQATFTANPATNMNGSSLIAIRGGQIEMNGTTSYDSFSRPTWRADGIGSIVSLPNLQSIVNPAAGGNGNDLVIEALNGGVVQLNSLVQMTDPAAGNVAANEFLFTADGAGSRIEVPVLTQINDRDNLFGYSAITAANGGSVLAPLLTSVRGTQLVLNGTGPLSMPIGLPIGQITSFTGGRLTLDGPNLAGTEYPFVGITDFTRSVADVNGVDMTLPNVTTANGASFVIRGGVSLTVPGITTYDSFSRPTWRADGIGSIVSLPNLQSIVNPAAGGNGNDLVIEALNGGVVQLNSLVQMTDPAAGNVAANEFLFTADGAGSRIEVPVLTQINDRDNAFGLSSMTAANFGCVILNLNLVTQLNNMSIALAGNGVIEGNVELATGSSLTGSGTVNGDLVSGVTVAPIGQLRVEGDYLQHTEGVLDIEVFGGQPEQADRLVVGGVANVRGELRVHTSAYSPILGDSYPVFQFGLRQGDFDLMSGLNLGNYKILVPRYTGNRLTLVTASSIGTGVFQSTGQSPGSANARGVALGDVDLDGDLDAFVVNGDLGPDKVWLNNGTATFVDSGQSLGAADGTSIGLGDFDRDGDLDAYVTGTLGDRVWRNQGYAQGGTIGVFVDMGALFTGGSRAKVAVGDVDGDGDLDAFVAVSSGGNRVLINQGGTGTGWLGFADSSQLLGTLASVDVQLDDVDGDNDLDAVVANAGGGNQLWRNQGGSQAGTQGEFVLAAGTIGTGTSTGVDLADLDNDGDVDAFFTTAIGSTVWRNNGTGVFISTGQTLSTPPGSGGVAVSLGDFDGDGDIDAFVADTYGSGLIHSVWFNQGAGTFYDTGQQLGSIAGTDVEIGDLDGDGDLDSFVSNGHPPDLLGNSIYRNVAAVDFGDAPDPTYPTTLSSNGAGHVIVTGIHLGTSVDAEPDGSPHPFALGDDLNVDDENGVVFVNPLYVGVANSVDVTASAPGKLDAWIDFNSDGDWDDSGEKVFVSVSLTAGSNALNFVVPSTATATFATFARFRFSTTGGLTPRGIAANGEVEDYFVPIEELDLGDAPTRFTYLADNGARHAIVAGYQLGNGITSEGDGQPNSLATGDANDDGVVLPSTIYIGKSAQVTITTTAAGMIDAWIDFNNDNDWDDPGENVFTSVVIGAGINNLTLNVPATAIVDRRSFARFRFSSVGGLMPGGSAPNGEVEDYRVRIAVFRNWQATGDLETTAGNRPPGSFLNGLIGDADLWDFSPIQLMSYAKVNVWKKEPMPAPFHSVVWNLTDRQEIEPPLEAIESVDRRSAQSLAVDCAPQRSRHERTIDQLYSGLGHGGIKPGSFIRRLSNSADATAL